MTRRHDDDDDNDDRHDDYFDDDAVVHSRPVCERSKLGPESGLAIDFPKAASKKKKRAFETSEGLS
eukprot:4669745-Amphidinium_carterae.1